MKHFKSEILNLPRRTGFSRVKAGRKSAKLLLGVTLTSLLFGAGLLYLTRSTEAAWFNDNWSYRKKILFPTHSSEESDVYFQFTIDTSTLISAGKLQSDCGDLRFTQYNGSVMPYYISSGCNTSSTAIQVLFDTYPAGDIAIFMYYGNPSALDGTQGSAFTTAASNSSVTVNVQVGSSSDDGDVDEAADLANSLTRTSLPIGSYSGNAHLIATRFNSVAVPQGANITSATYTLTGSDTYDCGSCNMDYLIFGDDADDSAALTLTNMNDRTSTSATVAWSQQAVVLDTEYDNNVTAIVQEIVNRGSWSSGNNMSILVEDNGSDGSEWQEFYSYDNSIYKILNRVQDDRIICYSIIHKS